MNTDDLRLLAARAEGVEGRQAERLTELHGRIRTARHRRSATKAVAAVVLAVAVVAGGLAVLGGGADRTVAPVDTKTPRPPSPTEEGEVPAGQQTVLPDIGAGDIGGWELRASRTNAQPGSEGATDLTLTVAAPPFSGFTGLPSFCNGDPGTWWVLTIDLGGVDGGRNADGSMQDGSRGVFGRCSPGDPTSVPPPAGDIEPGRRDDSSRPTPMRMFVTGPLSATAQRCLRSTDAVSCPARHGLAPLTGTDATFGFGVYEPRRAPTVLEIDGIGRFEALGVADSVEYLIDRAVLPAEGAPRLVVPLPASDGRRIVGLVRGGDTPSLEACVARLGHGRPSDANEERAQYEEVDRRCLADVELRVDGERPATQEHEFSFAEQQVVLGPGEAHDVTVDVVRNDPRNVRYALVVWAERP